MADARKLGSGGSAAILWSVFESRALENDANVDNICKLVYKWELDGRLANKQFTSELSYVQSRYFAQGNFTEHFRRLKLERNKKGLALIEPVIRNTKTNTADVLKAFLCIVYRFRNNLFHGLKWEHDFIEELENLSHMNALLTRAIELASKIGDS